MFPRAISLTTSSNAFCLLSFCLYIALFMSHRHGCCLYSSTNLHVNSSFHLAGIFSSQTALRRSQQIIRILLNCAVLTAVGVYTRQVNGEGRLLASKIELPSILLPCLPACQACCLASNFRKVSGHTGQLTCSKLLVHLPCLATGLV
jgi:hypothetical protein